MNRFVFPTLLAMIAVAGASLGYLVAPSPQAHSDFYAPAIIDNGQGVLVKFRVSLYPGSGKTLVNVQNSFYREDSENALVKAKKNAEDILGVKLIYHDLVLDVESIGSEVGGESAGAMFTLGILSAYSGRKINDEVTMSAGITDDGLLFAVDSIEEKILAAKQSGKKKFIVSATQGIKNAEQIEGIEIIKAKNIREAAEQILA